MINRRSLLAAGGLSLLPLRPAGAATRQTRTIELAPGQIVLKPGHPPIPAWRFVPNEPLRFAQGDEVDITMVNRLPVPVSITWRGLDGAPALEPILARRPIPAGGSDLFSLSLAHAGTLLCDARPAGDTAPQALPGVPLIVAEKQPVEADQDIPLLLEDWRDGPDPVFTVNGFAACSVKARPLDRLRLRFINSSQDTVLAAQLLGIDVRVVAIDGQPSESFLARDGRILLAPGTRIDAIVDAAETGSHALTVSDGKNTVKCGEIVIEGIAQRTQPPQAFAHLPSNGLPDKIPLQQALRVDVSLDPAGWANLQILQPSTTPEFKVKRGRPVVLALTNPSEAVLVFHLHGHHMRLLDRLDDGWKPFWLDTIAVPPKQTVRMAFLAAHVGAFLIELAATGEQPVRKLKIYQVDA